MNVQIDALTLPIQAASVKATVPSVKATSTFIDNWLSWNHSRALAWRTQGQVAPNDDSTLIEVD